MDGRVDHLGFPPPGTFRVIPDGVMLQPHACLVFSTGVSQTRLHRERQDAGVEHRARASRAKVTREGERDVASFVGLGDELRHPEIQ